MPDTYYKEYEYISQTDRQCLRHIFTKSCFQIVPDPNNDLTTAAGIYNARYTTKTTYVDNEKSLAGWTPNRDEWLPFPENELEVNSNLKQNPGY